MNLPAFICNWRTHAQVWRICDLQPFKIQLCCQLLKLGGAKQQLPRRYIRQTCHICCHAITSFMQHNNNARYNNAINDRIMLKSYTRKQIRTHIRNLTCKCCCWWLRMCMWEYQHCRLPCSCAWLLHAF